MMRKCFLLLGILLFSFSAMLVAEGEVFSESSLLPLSPEVVAQGSSFTALAHGYNALFTNPAGFAREGGSLTIVAANPWIYARPDWLLEDGKAAEADNFSDASIRSLLERQIIGYYDEEGNPRPGNGIGAGASVGIGFVGRGLGLGVVGTTDAYFYGKRLLGTEGYLKTNLSIIGGFALPFRLSGITLNAGVDARYFLQTHSRLNAGTASDVLLSSLGGSQGPWNLVQNVPTLNGYGLAFDLGMTADIGPFSAGLAVRDFLGTRISYATHNLGDIFTTLSEKGGLPEELQSDSTPEYIVPATVNLGVAFHPDFGNAEFIIDPVVHAEVKDVFGAVNENGSFWTRLHLGTEVKLLNFLKLRAGLNQGYVTMGGGIHLFFLDLNAALFTSEMGVLAGDRPASGASLELAIRL